MFIFYILFERNNKMLLIQFSQPCNSDPVRLFQKIRYAYYETKMRNTILCYSKSITERTRMRNVVVCFSHFKNVQYSYKRERNNITAGWPLAN